MRHERPQRIMAGESEAVAVMRLALVPACGGQELEHAVDRLLARGRGEESLLAGQPEQQPDLRLAVS